MKRHYLALGLLALLHLAAADAVDIGAPASVGIGAPVAVSFTDDGDRNDFVTIVAPQTPEGQYGAYQYARSSPVELTAPQEPGIWEIRYLGAARPYPTLARATLEVTPVTATLRVPETVPAGGAVAIDWEGPGNARDFITIVPAAAPEGSYETYAYAKSGSPLTLQAPDEAGAYEVRYLLGDSPYPTIGRADLAVGGTTATVTVPPSVLAGAPVSIVWIGPDNEGDFITIVAADRAEGEWDDYGYARAGSPLTLAAPEEPGDYEVRYLTGQSHATLARSPLVVTPATASLEAPESAEARSIIEVAWEGPGNDQDYVAIHRVSDDNRSNAPYAYVRRGPRLRLEVPDEPGTYELRYITGGRQLTLAKRPLTVTPRPAPGFLRVVSGATQAGLGAGATVAVVLDASGSMLQRLDGTRRIELARGAVQELVQDGLPDGVDFGLWVFGHREPDTCRTDVEIPVGPLDRGRASAVVGTVNAMNLARTPIAASLSQVAAALAGRSGERLIILVTDGEETCDGDPAAVIEALAAGKLDVRINIVGFAIDELMLAETFRRWAALGNGRYFDARDAAALGRSLREAVNPNFELLDAAGRVVARGAVNGEQLTVPPGRYEVRASASATAAGSVVVRADEETLVTLD